MTLAYHIGLPSKVLTHKYIFLVVVNTRSAN